MRWRAMHRRKRKRRRLAEQAARVAAIRREIEIAMQEAPEEGAGR